MTAMPSSGDRRRPGGLARCHVPPRRQPRVVRRRGGRGPLTTPYHGSGEHVLRDDYRLVDGMMIPHSFTISRAAGGERFPFWNGAIETITFHAAD